ncbi:LCP family protein [Streptomyces sp. NPDC053499]|uniref:LCP family protein n=1 Tax=Streptomyces sp. NPDC053499 TaxID=3365707 RepID=UPI0037D145CE
MSEPLGGWPEDHHYDGEAGAPRIIPAEAWPSHAAHMRDAHPEQPSGALPYGPGDAERPLIPRQRSGYQQYGAGVPANGTPGAGARPLGAGARSPGAGAPGAGAPGNLSRNRSPRAARARRRRPRRITRLLLLTVCVLLVASGGTYVWADSGLNRKVDLDKVADRPPRGKGTNYLIVGSDSREGLSEDDKKNLHTGAAVGGRTDSMILLHTGAHGTTMMSLPRDSWVTIPSFVRPETGRRYRAAGNKLNAAYSLGGPDLLVRTVEHNTGLHIDHYAEIGFAGFVGVVDAVGGVKMCVDRHIKDEKSGLDLAKGCHILDGSQALAFVRQRHQEADGDLGRNRNQQKFLAALAHKAAEPGVALNPFTAYPAMSAGLETLVVDKNTGLRDLTSLFEAMRGVSAGRGKQVRIPVASLGFKTAKGSAVKWNRPRAKKLFTELRYDRPVSFKGEK